MPAEKDDYFTELIKQTWNLKQAAHFTSPKHTKALEDKVFEKVRQKTLSKEHEGQTLAKAINYIDKAGKGFLTIETFSKVLVYLGCILSNDDAYSLFSTYDIEGTGRVSSAKLIDIFANRSTGNKPNPRTNFKLGAPLPSQTLLKIKKALISQGMHGIRKLNLLFKKVDFGNSLKVDRAEFAGVIKECGLELTVDDFQKLLSYYECPKSGIISYEDVMKGIRGELAERRRDCVKYLWDMIKKEKGPLDFITENYLVDKHPKVVAGKMSKKQAIDEFLLYFNANKKEITQSDFEEYYKDISPSIDRDDYFEQLLINTWKYPEQGK